MGSRSSEIRGRLSAALAAWLLFLAGPAGAGCSEGAVSIRGDWGTARFTVKVADTPSEQSRGLMFVEDLPTMSGMLFVYPRPQPTSFWMRNTLIPLDMLFFDETGTLTRLHAMAQPLDETPIPGGDAVQFVLEINGGLANRLGIAPGNVMRHPSVGAAAAWPCPND
ncbi:MAG: DUF192 domain-containing protein [Alphaproteobacteria bacterium]|jgi:uncharacterized membrane protein (UPF0127 family)|nr:DUF192 domain-containing protein [Alphaproteobacteria bacterium]